MDKIRCCVNELIDRYHSADPQFLCERLGIQILDQDLPACVNGFTVKRQSRESDPEEL